MHVSEVPCFRIPGVPKLLQSDTSITAMHDALHTCTHKDESVHNMNTYNGTSKQALSGISEWYEPIAGLCSAHLAAGSGTNLKCSAANINRNRTEVHDWPHPTLLHDIKSYFEIKPQHAKCILWHNHLNLNSSPPCCRDPLWPVNMLTHGLRLCQHQHKIWSTKHQPPPTTPCQHSPMWPKWAAALRLKGSFVGFQVKLCMQQCDDTIKCHREMEKPTKKTVPS